MPIFLKIKKSITFLLFLSFLSYACSHTNTSPQKNKIGRLPNMTNVPDQNKEITNNLYVKNKKIVLENHQKVNNSGSLFDSSNEKNFLFTSRPADEMGRLVEVEISTSPKSNPITSPAAAASDAAKAPADKKSTEDELLSQFPSLKPKDENSQHIIKSLKMEIIQKLPNGNLVLMYHRSSDAINETNEIHVTAKLPAQKLWEGKPVSNQDLFDVQFSQSSDKEVIAKSSLSWEDEYTLRISGFNESSSAQAKELEDKRKDLMNLKDKLYKRVIDFGKERDRLTKERDKMSEDRKKDVETIQNLQDQLRDINKDSNKPSQPAPLAPIVPPTPASLGSK